MDAVETGAEGALLRAARRVPPAVWVLLAGVVWSFGGVLSKGTTWGALPLQGARSLIGLLILGFARGGFRVKLSAGVWMGGLGASVTGVLFMFANKLTTAANAIVLQYAMPILVVIASAIFLKTRITRLELFSIAAVTLGVALCFSQGFRAGAGGTALLGDALALLSAATYACVFFASRLTGCEPLDFAYFGSVLGCALLALIPFDAGVSFVPDQLLRVLAMGTALGVGYLFLSLGLRGGISPVASAIVANVEPVLNPTWAFLFLGENPGGLAIAGAAVVLGAVTVYSLWAGKMVRDAKRRAEGATP